MTYGFQTGKLATNLGTDAAGPVSFGTWLLPISLFPLSLGLLGIFILLHGHSRVLGITGMSFAVLGMVLGLGDLVDLAGAFGKGAPHNDLFGGLGAFAVVIGTAFLGVASLSMPILAGIGHLGHSTIHRSWLLAGLMILQGLLIDAGRLGLVYVSALHLISERFRAVHI